MINKLFVRFRHYSTILFAMTACFALNGCQFIYMVQQQRSEPVTDPITIANSYQPYEFTSQEMITNQLNAIHEKPELTEGQWYNAAPFWVQLENPTLGHYILQYFAKDISNITRLDKPGSIDIHAFTIRGNKAWTQRHPMVFKPITIKDKVYAVATFDLGQSTLPLSRLETKLQMKFPVNLQSKSVHASQVGQKIPVHRELLAIQKLKNSEAIVYHEGTPELFFGLTGFNKDQQALIPVEVNTTTTKKKRTRYQYIYDQPLDHIDLHIADSVIKPQKSMTFIADSFYYQLGANVVTFEEHPSISTRKVTPGRSTLHTPEHTVKIEKNVLVINKVSYGKITGQSWIHIKPNGVNINGTLAQPQ